MPCFCSHNGEEFAGRRGPWTRFMRCFLISVPTLFTLPYICWNDFCMSDSAWQPLRLQIVSSRTPLQRAVLSDGWGIVQPLASSRWSCARPRGFHCAAGPIITGDSGNWWRRLPVCLPLQGCDTSCAQIRSAHNLSQLMSKQHTAPFRPAPAAAASPRCR